MGRERPEWLTVIDGGMNHHSGVEQQKTDVDLPSVDMDSTGHATALLASGFVDLGLREEFQSRIQNLEVHLVANRPDRHILTSRLVSEEGQDSGDWLPLGLISKNRIVGNAQVVFDAIKELGLTRCQNRLKPVDDQYDDIIGSKGCCIESSCDRCEPHVLASVQSGMEMIKNKLVAEVLAESVVAQYLFSGNTSGVNLSSECFLDNRLNLTSMRVAGLGVERRRAEYMRFIYGVGLLGVRHALWESGRYAPDQVDNIQHAMKKIASGRVVNLTYDQANVKDVGMAYAYDLLQIKSTVESWKPRHLFADSDMDAYFASFPDPDGSMEA